MTKCVKLVKFATCTFHEPNFEFDADFKTFAKRLNFSWNKSTVLELSAFNLGDGETRVYYHLSSPVEFQFDLSCR